VAHENAPTLSLCLSATDVAGAIYTSIFHVWALMGAIDVNASNGNVANVNATDIYPVRVPWLRATMLT